MFAHKKKVTRKVAVAVRKWPAMAQQDDLDSPEKVYSDEIEPESPPRSTFRIAIQGSQQGIAYLILDNGYDYMFAMQDALDESKF